MLIVVLARFTIWKEEVLEPSQLLVYHARHKILSEPDSQVKRAA